MAKYLPTVDLWNAANREALDAGTLKLQPGQWIKCGGHTLSRFYRHNPRGGHIVAFHGEPGNQAIATRKMREYVASGRRVR
jgi:hypothetical protein